MLGRPAISVEVQRSFWAAIRTGEIIDTAAAAVGVSKTVGWRWFREAGGVMPPQRRESADRPVRLSFADREEIACRRAAGEGVRAIARAIGRSRAARCVRRAWSSTGEVHAQEVSSPPLPRDPGFAANSRDLRETNIRTVPSDGRPSLQTHVIEFLAASGRTHSGSSSVRVNVLQGDCARWASWYFSSVGGAG